MKNPLAQAQKSALAMNDDIGELFAAVGSSAHPRGFVTTAYRNARRAMKTALMEADPRYAAREVFTGLRSTIRGGTLETLGIAQELGLEEAARQLRFYEIVTNPTITQAEREASAAALDAIVTKINAQEAQTNALLMLDPDPTQIIGDEERAGTLREGEVVTAVTTWTASLLWAAFSRGATSTPYPEPFSKQVIAALDSRTTDCCLRAHGQIVPLNKPFHLTGTPRFADYLDWTPFHYRCRTSIALYRESYDDGLTAEMRAGARTIMAERAADGTGDRHPANAFASY